jgi:GT2 family glycosyltransferase
MEVNDVKVSVIIATLGKRLRELESCLQSVLSQTYKSFEVILINDGAIEPVMAIVHSFKNLNCKIKVIHNTKRVGPAVARNIGLMHAKGKYVAFIDDDAVAKKDWLERLLRAYVKDDVGGVGGTTIQITSGRVKQRSMFTKVLDTTYANIKEPSETQFLCGTNMSFKTDILRSINGFDPNLGLISFFEDTDISLSVRELGYKLICEPAAVVVHHDIPDGGCTAPPAKTWFWFARNRLYVVLKHPKFFRSIITVTAFSKNCFLKIFRRFKSGHYPIKTCALGILYVTKGLIEAVIVHLVSKLHRKSIAERNNR